ncbi:MAG TPA: flavin-dependent monooxygenase [Stellaceae bacterium]|jgi:3-hydroxy-9,10-secoandrosta-1,3,5(10)-triene-9,17-dione monooxygenase|nr:flavin-dependent monooxygenase [Stellaceae bacterium]
MSPETYLERVRSLLPVLRERAAHAEKLRRLPDETFADLQEAGLLRALQPKRYGGFELDPGVFYQAVTEVAAVCGSTGWVLGVLGVHNWHVAILQPQAQEDVWGEDDSVQLSTSLAPTGTVERAPAGYRLRGRWSFSSGCDHCRWAVLGGNAPAARPGEPPDPRVFLVPRRDYAIDDNWRVVGLCGTGSKNIVVEDAFVPEYRTHSYRDAFALNHPGAAVNKAPLYRLPFGLVFTYGIVSPAIGAAAGALEAFREQALRRINVRDGSRAVEDPFMQYRLAEAAAEIDAARDRMLANFAEMMRLARAGKEIPLAMRARCRWDSGKAVDRSVNAVDRLFEASGGHALFLDNPIQRAWRDVHAMRAHAGNNPERASFIFARSEFGLPPQDIRF